MIISASIRRLLPWALLAALSAPFLPSPGNRAQIALAYSYGNPTNEEIVEAYQTFAGALNETPPDFAKARTTLAAVEPDARLHFGDAPVDAVRAALDTRRPETAVVGFRKLLVLNIARRVDNARLGIDQFAQAKILLAKAFSTYDALSPFVKAKQAALDTRLRQSFDGLLKALGNPGLFGIGRRDPDPATFERLQNEILAALSAQFDVEVRVGHFLETREPKGK